MLKLEPRNVVLQATETGGIYAENADAIPAYKMLRDRNTPQRFPEGLQVLLVDCVTLFHHIPGIEPMDAVLHAMRYRNVWVGCGNHAVRCVSGGNKLEVSRMEGISYIFTAIGQGIDDAAARLSGPPPIGPSND